MDKLTRITIQQELSRRGLLRSAAALGVVAALGPRLAGAQDASPIAEEVPPVTLPRFDGQELSFMIIQPHAVTGDHLVRDFEAATGAKVNLTTVNYDEVQAKATLDVQSGANQFDVFDYWYPTIGALVRDGILADLTEFIESDPEINTADFIPSIYDTYTLYDGKRWGLPYDGDTHVLFYNAEIFNQLGLSAPETWDQVTTNAQTITEAGLTNADGNQVYGLGIMGVKVPILLGSSYINRFAGYGGRFFKEDGTPDIGSEVAVQAAQALFDQAQWALPTPLETAFEQALPAFSSGQTAMQDFWTDLGVYAESAEGTKVAGKWEVVQNPVGGSNTTHIAPLNAGFAFGVSSATEKKELAQAFVKFATSANFHIKMLNTVGSGIDPMRLSGLNSPSYTAFAPKVQQAAGAALSGVLPWPTIPEMPDIMTKLADELALLLQGSQDAATTMANVQAGWVEILGG